ncbi:type VII secretion-associated protein [Mycobacterium sp.]|uniref:type VII secretion-associated protein n=1 Tax=Mycobacterium sp. TaxID=1785 RepID=UPI003BAE513A
MRAHIVEVGPTAVRRLCCGGATVVDSEAEKAAFEHIDDAVTLIDFRPVSVKSLWHSMLATVDCGTAEEVIVVHPSWWAPKRVDVVTVAAEAFAGDVVMRPRSWLLRQASRPPGLATLVAEIADDFVAIVDAAVVAETRRRDQRAVADSVVRSIVSMASNTSELVIIDAPRTVRGAGPLSVLIANGLRKSGVMTVLEVDDIGLRRIAGAVVPTEKLVRSSSCRIAAGRRRLRNLALVLPAVSVMIGVAALIRHPAPRAGDPGISTTYIVEGHVAVQVPDQWPMRRVLAGPGSARVQISSPSDPEVALHVTQSRVALGSLDATAEFLKSAIDGAPAGVFVDFNPAGRSAGRAAVTYREIRPGHDIRWTVWVDTAVRISIGCQSRHDRDDAVNRECDVAIRSARALD